MKKETEQQDKALSTRERMTILVLLLIVKVIKPFDWAHELDKMLEEFKDEMKKEK